MALQEERERAGLISHFSFPGRAEAFAVVRDTPESIVECALLCAERHADSEGVYKHCALFAPGADTEVRARREDAGADCNFCTLTAHCALCAVISKGCAGATAVVTYCAIFEPDKVEAVRVRQVDACGRAPRAGATEFSEFDARVGRAATHKDNFRNCNAPFHFAKIAETLCGVRQGSARKGRIFTPSCVVRECAKVAPVEGRKI